MPKRVTLMATRRPKRKAAASPKGSRKRYEQASDSAGEYYSARAILKENDTKYLIDWEPVSGEEYKPSWQPKDHANQELVRAWEVQKNKGVAEPLYQRDLPLLSFTTRSHAHRVKPRSEEIPSSPPFSEPSSSNLNPQTAFRGSGPTPGQTPSVAASEESGRLRSISPLFETQPAPEPEPQLERRVTNSPGEQAFVQLSQHSSFDREAYQTFSSQIPLSAAGDGAHPLTTSGSSLRNQDPSSSCPRVRGGAFRVVPDSQSLPGSSSYKPTTQSSAKQTGSPQSKTGDDLSILSSRPEPQFCQLWGLVPVGRESDPIAGSNPVLQDSPKGSGGSVFQTNASQIQTRNQNSHIHNNIFHSENIEGEVEEPRTYFKHGPHPPSSTVAPTLPQNITSNQTNSLRFGGSNTEFSRSTQKSTNNESRSRVDSSTSEKDFAPSVLPSIEIEPRLGSSGQKSRQTSQFVDQADISTEGEYTGPSDPLTPREEQRGARPQTPLPVLATQSSVVPNTVLESHLLRNSQVFSGRENVSQESPPQPQTPLNHAMEDARQAKTSQPQADTTTRSPIASNLRESIRQIRAGSNLPSKQRSQLPDVTQATASRAQSNTTTPASIASEVREDIRKLRTRSSSRAPASQLGQVSRSPSTIPDKLPVVPRLEGPSSASRVTEFTIKDTEPPAAKIATTMGTQMDGHESPKERSSDTDSSLSDILSDQSMVDPFPRLGEEDYVISLPMADSFVDQYHRYIKMNGDFITNFVENRWDENESSKSKAKDLATWLRMCSTHVDLILESSMSQEGLLPADVVSWDIKNSKFAFLDGIIEATRNSPYDVLVVCQPGPVVQLLQRLFQGREVKHRLATTDNAADEDPVTLRFSILTRTSKNESLNLPRPNLIIDFDNSLSHTDPFGPVDRARKLQGSVFGRKKWVPIVHLFVSNSIEHVERCLPGDIIGKDIERLQHVLYKSSSLRRKVGAGSLCPKPADAAQSVVAYTTAAVEEDAMPKWPFSEPPVITDFWLPSQGPPTTEETATALPDGPSLQKRPIDDSPEQANKRLRLSNQLASTAGNASVTHISDSVNAPSSGMHPLISSSKADDGSGEQAIRDQMALLEAKCRELERQNRQYKSSLQDLQTQFEDKSRLQRETIQEREDLRANIVKLQKQLESKDTRMAALIEQRNTAQAELKVASEALKASNVGELQEFERIRSAAADKDKVEARLKSQENQNEYLRTEYQNASSRAAELMNQVQSLLARNQHLELQANGEAAKLRQMVLTDERKTWARELDRKDGRIRDLEGLVSRLKEENISIKTQRALGTRANSLPRSPRLGPASRVGSPAPMQFGSTGPRINRLQGIRD